MIAGNSGAHQKAGANPSREGNTNTDMRQGTGGNGVDLTGGGQGNGTTKWQQNPTLDGKAQNLYTQINSPIYKQSNYPGIPKTTTNRMQVSRGKQQFVMEQTAPQPSNYSNLQYQQRQNQSNGRGVKQEVKASRTIYLD